MHAVVVRVTIRDPEASDRELRERIVPGVAAAPGFVTGYWTRKDDTGLAMVVFDSEETARQMEERVPSVIPPSVTLDSVEVREVAAHA